MRTQKVLDNNQISWFNEGSKRLNYQMIFNESEVRNEEDEYSEKTTDINELLDERDSRWKRKLEQVRNEAYAEGFNAGQTEGIEKARSEIDDKISVIKEAMTQAHEEWKTRQQILEPGLLDMVFEISESILGIPVENPAIRESLEEKIVPLLQKINEQSKPILWVCEDDLEFVQALKDDFSKSMVLNMQVSEDCNPGEFRLETQEETVVHNFREMLDEFKKTLALPSWK
ncbi:FliH/SctL family protein [Gracilimonas sp. BCB1]|uniref:FliH/SctL family protein n=1 Tax=Gracilimonas sp. BCB1 TaxID=3152362 RepID=UPI0032D9639A